VTQLRIRPAQASDCSTLTDISFQAKRHWKYPDEYMELWKEELTITAAYIANNTVFVGELEGEPVGFYSLAEMKDDLKVGTILIEKGVWLDHMFIYPKHIGKRIGTEFTAHMKSYLAGKKVDAVLIFVDPNAEGFYGKVGAKFRRDSDSSIPGRTIPVYELAIT